MQFPHIHPSCISTFIFFFANKCIFEYVIWKHGLILSLINRFVGLQPFLKLVQRLG